MNSILTHSRSNMLRKRVISLLLVCTLVCSLFVTAWASDDEEDIMEEPGESEIFEEPGSESEEEDPVSEESEELPDSPGEGDPGEEVPGEEVIGSEESDGEEPDEPDEEAEPEDAGKETVSGSESDPDSSDGPEAVLPGLHLEDITVQLGDETFNLLDGVTASDAEGNPIDVIEITDDGGFDIDTIGDYTVTYSAADPVDSAVYEGSRTVTVEPLGFMLLDALPEDADETVDTYADLQAAITSAADGLETIILIAGDIDFTGEGALNIPAGKTIVLLSDEGSPATLTQTDVDVRHISVSANATLTIQDLVLDGGDTGGGIENKGTLSLEDGSVIRNCGHSGTLSDETQRGGAVYNAGTFIMYGGELHGNTTGSLSVDSRNMAHGGGVHNSGSFTMLGGEIYDNTAYGYHGGYGGGVYNTGSFKLDGGDIHDNLTYAYASSLEGLGGGLYSTGTATLETGEIYDNQANYAGGIYIHADGSLTINGGQIHGNYATRIGAGIVNYGTLDMTDGEIYANRNGSSSGGGIMNYGALTMSGGKIHSHTTAMYGGGIHQSGGSLTLTGGEIYGNTTSQAGGGIYVVKGDFVMSGGKIHHNTSVDSLHGGGAGIYLTCISPINSPVTAAITGGEIYENTASAASGGGIYIGGYPTITAFKNVSIYDNTALGAAGIFTSVDLTMENCVIENNTATFGNAGGILNSGTLTLKDSKVSNNRATVNGGGVYNIGDLTLINSTITYNTTGTANGTMYSGQGGGVYSGNSGQDTSFVMESGEISNNTAVKGNSKYYTGEGGGVFILNRATFTINGGKITNNTAGTHGGGIAVYSSSSANFVDSLHTVSITSPDVILNNNTASDYYYITNPAHITLHTQQIATLNEPFSNNMEYAYNNLDISYTSGIAGSAQFQVLFTANGGTLTDASFQNVQYLGYATEPTPPTASNRVFKGWYTTSSNGEKWDFDTMQVTRNIILYAQWDSLYTVTFDPNGGTLTDTSTQSVINGDYAAEPSEPVNPGYNFDGWYTNATGGIKWNFTTMPINNSRILYAQWTEIQAATATVTFDANGGTLNDLATQDVAPGGYASEPAAPARTSYTFDGWYTEQVRENGIKWVFSTMPVTDDITLYAQWTKIHTVTFDEAGGSYKPSNQSIMDGQTATQPTKPTKTGYSLEGWYLKNTDTQWDFTDPVKSDLDLVARWTPDTYTVKFDAAGGSPTPDDQSITYGETATKPATEPTQRGYKFEYWYYINENSPWDFDTLVTGNMTLHAKWSQKVYTISYDLNGGDGTTPASDSHVHQDEVYVPEQGDITRDGYTFLGWSKSPTGNDTIYKAKEDTYNFLMPTRSFTLYAVWRADSGYTVTVEHYQYQGDFSTATPVLVDTDSPVAVSYGDSFTAVPKTYPGYLFMESLSETSIDSVVNPATLKLYYQKAEGYQILFNSNVTDGKTTLEVLDRRIPDAAYTWEEFLAHTEPRIYYEDQEITGITFTSANFSSLNLQELTRGTPYTVEIRASWSSGTGTLETTLLLDVVDTTPPEITVSTSRIDFGWNESASGMGSLLAVIQPQVSDNYDQSVPFNAYFANTDFNAIDWRKPYEYHLYIEATDSSGNEASRKIVIISVAGGDTGSGGSSGGSGGSGSGGGSSTPDEHGRYVVLDDDGVPLGFYVQDDNGNWTYIDAEDVPLGTLPQTGDNRPLGLAVVCMTAAFAVLVYRGKKKI